MNERKTCSCRTAGLQAGSCHRLNDKDAGPEAGGPARVDENGNVATVTIADVKQSNGVIHVVDTVLLEAHGRPVHERLRAASDRVMVGVLKSARGGALKQDRSGGPSDRRAARRFERDLEQLVGDGGGQGVELEGRRAGRVDQSDRAGTDGTIP